MAEKMQNGCTTPHMRSSENAVKRKFAPDSIKVEFGPAPVLVA